MLKEHSGRRSATVSRSLLWTSAARHGTTYRLDYVGSVDSSIEIERCCVSEGGMLKYTMALAACLLSISDAQSATLSSATGEVLVNAGRGFERATAGQELKPGDRVMVGRGGGEAVISYDLTCVDTVAVGRVATVVPNIPCNVPGVDGAGAAAGAGIPQGVLIAGGVAVAVGGGLLIYNATKKKNSP
jgi:hypothetical protein